MPLLLQVQETSSSIPLLPELNVERETEVDKDRFMVAYSTNNGSTTDVQPPVVQDQPQVPNSEPVVAPVSASMPKPSIPYPSRRNDERRQLTPTCMTLELRTRLDFPTIGIAEDVYLKVGKFKFPADFVVVDFDADPRVPLIIRRSFLKTERALIDVYEGELTLRVGKEAVTFNLDQTLRYSSNYDEMTANRIDVIEMAYEGVLSRSVAVIIAKYFECRGKSRFYKGFEANKRAIAWKLPTSRVLTSYLLYSQDSYGRGLQTGGSTPKTGESKSTIVHQKGVEITS
ncbi:reverse transcriptase domain-containing protein [Tanacetum coccineum]